MIVIPVSNLLDSLEGMATAMADAIQEVPRCVCAEPSLVNVIDDLMWGCVICDGLILKDNINPLEGFAS